jgi:ABC-type bacteriocin/lantibiotic exporter with double-glycine peptidase domain
MEQRKIFSDQLFDSLSLQALPGRIIEIFAVLGLFILIVIAKWTGNADSGTLITVGAFMAAAYKIIPGIVKIINLAGQLKAYDLRAEELQIFSPASGSNQARQSIHSVELRNVSFSYGNEEVLKNINLSVKRKDLLGISGASGQGKTTLLNVLLGFLQPSKGEVLYNGDKASEDEIMEYWSSIAYVRQQSFFIYDTILRNITLEDKEHDPSRLDAAISISGLNAVISHFPEGINKIITENGKNISGGQQQRIAIARALYKNADLLLLDEPFNELDESSTISILDHLKQMAAEGKIIILITHDKSSLNYCNKQLSLDV